MEITAAKVGRFYGEGLLWALTLPLPALLRWAWMIPKVEDNERGR